MARAIRDDAAGLFGPSSVTWRVHADPLMGLAGLRALLLQTLHPRAMTAIDEHSRYREDPWGRLAATVEYVGVTTYGSTGDALAAGARVRAVHAMVHGTDGGEPYSANEPELLRWVHCCLVDSFLSVTTRGGLALAKAERDGYLREQVRSASLVGLEPADVPDNEADLLAYFASQRGNLWVTRAAREAAAYVVAPPMPAPLALATPARPVWASVAGLAFASLPHWARRAFSLPELPGAAGLHDSATSVALRSLRSALMGVQVVVPALREGPHLRAARERLGRERPGGADPGGGPAS